MKANHKLLVILILVLICLQVVEDHRQIIFRIGLITAIGFLIYHYYETERRATVKMEESETKAQPHQLLPLQELIQKFNYWYGLTLQACQQKKQKTLINMSLQNTLMYYQEILNSLNSLQLDGSDYSPSDVAKQVKQKMITLKQQISKSQCADYPTINPDDTRDFLYNKNYSVF